MFCTKCGNEIEDGELFCGKCGAAIEQSNDLQQLSDTKSSNKRIGLIVGIIVFLVLSLTGIIVILVTSKYRATTMRLNDYEGDVELSDSKGSSLNVTRGRRLTDGNVLGTDDDSKAWVLLDEDRMVTIMQESDAEFHQRGKKMRLFLRDGALFFNIAKPLEEDETFVIETSTMAVGIRGTSGYITTDEGGNSVIYLTSGKVEVTGYNHDEDISDSVKISAGQKVTVIITDDGVELVVEDISEDSLPSDIFHEIFSDDDLLDEILDETDWDEELLRYYAGVAADEEETDSDKTTDLNSTGDIDYIVGEWYTETMNAERKIYVFDPDETGYSYTAGSENERNEFTWVYNQYEQDDEEYGCINITYDDPWVFKVWYYRHGVAEDMDDNKNIAYTRIQDGGSSSSSGLNSGESIMGLWTTDDADASIRAFYFTEEASYTLDEDGEWSDYRLVFEPHEEADVVYLYSIITSLSDRPLIFTHDNGVIYKVNSLYTRSDGTGITLPGEEAQVDDDQPAEGGSPADGGNGASAYTLVEWTYNDYLNYSQLNGYYTQDDGVGKVRILIGAPAQGAYADAGRIELWGQIVWVSYCGNGTFYGKYGNDQGVLLTFTAGDTVIIEYPAGSGMSYTFTKD